MPSKSISPIDIYKLLPQTNCQECGEANCMAFAVKLGNREAQLKTCPPLLEEKFREAFERLWDMVKPPVREIEVGTEKRNVKIGGQYVMFRHEMTYFNMPPIAIDVSDDMSDEEIMGRVKETENFTFTYIGMTLNLDMLAVRSVTNDKSRFKDVVKKVADSTDLPLILCSLDPKVVEAGLRVVGDRRPLIYAATLGNWRDMSELALTYKCPLVVYVPMI